MNRVFRIGQLALLLFAQSASLFAATNSPPSLTSGGLTGGALPKIEIGRIDVLGVNIFNSGDIIPLLEVQPGDRLEEVKVVRTAKNIQEFYRAHGYEEAIIKTELRRKLNAVGKYEDVLEFDVTEGKPTRIASVQFVPESVRDEVFQKYWAKIRSQLDKKAGFNPGDIFDQEKLNNGKHAITDLLASEEFVGARTDDVRVTTTSSPAGVTGSNSTDVARWVALEFHVDFGDRVSFGFVGNSAFTVGHLNSLVDGLRSVGFGKDYIVAIKARIEEEYHSEGYAQVKVASLTYENPTHQEKHVSYVITEGPRVTIDSVDFDGYQSFSNTELRDQFFAKASTMVQHNYYSERDVQKAADHVIEWIKSKGYLSAKLVTISTTYVPKPKNDKTLSVRLIVYLFEGDQTIVESVKVLGNSALNSDEIKKMLNVRENVPINLFTFNDGLESLKSAYRGKGYLEMRIANEESDQVVRYSQENRVADITIEIAEGPQFRVSRIEIEGLVKTKLDVVRREILFNEGDILEEPKITGTQARLRKLGIFSVVTVRTMDDPQKPGYKIVIVSADEGTPGYFSVGAGLRNDLGIRLFTGTGYTNFLGKNHTIALDVNVNRRIFGGYQFVETQDRLSYLWPWFIGVKDLSFRPSINASATQYIDFNAYAYGFSSAFERPILTYPKLKGVFTYSLQSIRQFDATNPVDNGAFVIGSITPSLELDMRDNPLSPHSGFFFNTSFEYADTWLGSQSNSINSGTGQLDGPNISYYRFQMRGDYFLPLGKDFTLYFHGRYGYERDNPVFETDSHGNVLRDANGNPIADPQSQIPLIEQFALGGASSLRGWAEQELNVQNEAIVGVLSYINYRIQLDMPLAGALRFGIFLDAANLNVDSVSFDNFLYGTGGGFHYDTPIGPVNLDVGYKLNENPDTINHPDLGRLQFYFTIGVL